MANERTFKKYESFYQEKYKYLNELIEKEIQFRNPNDDSIYQNQSFLKSLLHTDLQDTTPQPQIEIPDFIIKQDSPLISPQFKLLKKSNTSDIPKTIRQVKELTQTSKDKDELKSIPQRFNYLDNNFDYLNQVFEKRADQIKEFREINQHPSYYFPHENQLYWLQQLNESIIQKKIYEQRNQINPIEDEKDEHERKSTENSPEKIHSILIDVDYVVEEDIQPQLRRKESDEVFKTEEKIQNFDSLNEEKKGIPENNERCSISSSILKRPPQKKKNHRTQTAATAFASMLNINLIQQDSFKPIQNNTIGAPQIDTSGGIGKRSNTGGGFQRVQIEPIDQMTSPIALMGCDSEFQQISYSHTSTNFKREFSGRGQGLDQFLKKLHFNPSPQDYMSEQKKQIKLTWADQKIQQRMNQKELLHEEKKQKSRIDTPMSPQGLVKFFNSDENIQTQVSARPQTQHMRSQLSSQSVRNQNSIYSTKSNNLPTSPSSRAILLSSNKFKVFQFNNLFE